ncbi:MAG: ATP synthase F0 subunit B [Deltaproteobacteria bacterium]|jgi:F-type H+-transporting ATPase subunit b|nr:ATP synthase F0 subunit B [Deltaproteobacteria bacterium]
MKRLRKIFSSLSKPGLKVGPKAMAKALAMTMILAWAALALVGSFWLISEGALLAKPALASESSGQEGSETSGYSPERWRDFLYRVINFIVYVALLYVLLRKPVKNYFSGRRENLARTLEYLETQSRNLDEQTEAMRRQLDQLSQERLGILGQYERDGVKERDKIIAEAQKTAQIIIQRAEAAMELEIKTARQKLTAEIGQLAQNLAQKELAEKITDSDRSRLVVEFVDKVVKLPARKH